MPIPHRRSPVAFRNLKRKLLHFVFQPTCCFCGDEAPRGSEQEAIRNVAAESVEVEICSRCYENVINLAADRCYYCGNEAHPLNPFGSRCRICRHWNAKFDRAVAVGVYRGLLKDSILEIKRDCNDVKAQQIGSLLGEVAEKFDLPANIDCVVPVPSHWRRRMGRRGFHVADVMADGFCQVTGFRKNSQVLKCVRYTRKQAKLRPGQRTKNVRGAFNVPKPDAIRDKRVVLLDDVMTSGATIIECSKVLMEAGANSVFVTVAARAAGMS